LLTFKQSLLTSDVLAVSKVLTDPIFSNLLNFETERDTSEKHGTKSPNFFLEMYQFDLSYFVVYLSVLKLQRFVKVRAINTFEAAGIIYLLKC